MKAGENYFALHATLRCNISINLPLISILPPRNITTELQAGRQTTRQIIMTQAVASKSMASAERIKNQLFIGQFVSVFVLLINVFFSNNLIFNKYFITSCDNLSPSLSLSYLRRQENEPLHSVQLNQCYRHVCVLNWLAIIIY